MSADTEIQEFDEARRRVIASAAALMCGLHDDCDGDSSAITAAMRELGGWSDIIGRAIDELGDTALAARGRNSRGPGHARGDQGTVGFLLRNPYIASDLRLGAFREYQRQLRSEVAS